MTDVAAKINIDLIVARKSKKTTELQILQMLKSKIQEAEKRTGSITKEQAIDAVQNYHKTLVKATADYPDGDVLNALQGEIEFIETYLPKKADMTEVKALVQTAIAEAKMKKPGPIVGIVMKKLGRSGDGNLVKQLVEEALNGN